MRLQAETMTDREHLESLLKERYERLVDRLTALEALVEEKIKRMEALIESSERLLASTQDSAKEAVKTANEATQIRFNSFNEFNQRMNDLARTYLTIPAFDQFRKAIEEWKSLTSTRLDRREGESSGLRMSGSVLIAIIAAISAFLGIIAWFAGRGGVR